jgi:serine protease Do
MQRYFFSFLLIVALTPSSPAEVFSDTLKRSVEEAVAKVKPSLVRIHVVSADYQGGREIKSESSGSGAMITKEGHIVTNHHVAGHAVHLVCTLSDKSEIEAELIGTDPLSDISVIKLKPETPTEFPVVSFGDSAKVRVGDTVLAMGSPLALSQSVTLGIVSNTEMVMPDFFGSFNRFLLDGEDVGSMVLWLAHDADIYGGNSGGPLVNLEGEVIGINEIKFGLSGAIPGNLAKSVAFELIEKGTVERAWLGVEIQPQLKTAERKAGVLVSGALESSPAEEAGFESGDLLVELDGHPIEVRFAEQLPGLNTLVAALPIDREIEAVVLRDGERKVLSVTPRRREEVLPKERESKVWGITVQNLSFLLARELKRENRNGVLVTSVRSGGPSGQAKPSLEPHDIVVEVSGTVVYNVEEFLALTGKITEGIEEPVPTLTVYERKGQQYLTSVEVGLRELKDPGLEVKKAWLPVATQVLTRDLAEQLGIPKTKGVRVTQVYPHDALEEANLEVGDLIVFLEGEKIEASQLEDYEVFPALIREHTVGEKVKLGILREGNELEIEVELAQSPKLVREMKRYEEKHCEFTVRDISFLDKVSEDWPQDIAGVLVAEVVPGGWAALGDLSTGDLIQEIGGRPVDDVDGLEKEMSRVAEEKPDSLVFRVLRGIHTVYLEFEPEW